MRRYADILAAESCRAWRSLYYHGSVDLDASVEQLKLGVRLPAAADLAQARKILVGAPKEGNYCDRAQIYAHETLIVSETFAPTVRTFVQTRRIGDLGIATFPGEAFVELGLEIKKKSPFETQFLVELANDYRATFRPWKDTNTAAMRHGVPNRASSRPMPHPRWSLPRSASWKSWPGVLVGESHLRSKALRCLSTAWSFALTTSNE